MGNDDAGLIEKKKWYKNTMAILALVGTILGGAYAFVQFINPYLFSKSKASWNLEIVLDRSAAMAANLQNGTEKWQAAVAAVSENLKPLANKDNLALRKFGGGCDDDDTKLVVSFDHYNKDKVRRATEQITLEGEADLAAAVVEAVGDFNDRERFRGTQKSIVVITAVGDTCNDDPAAIIGKRLSKWFEGDVGIELDVHFVGLGVPQAQRNALEKIAKAMKANIQFTESLEETINVVEVIFEERPAFYKEDFEDGVGPEWSSTRIAKTPVGNRQFLGRFGSETVSVTRTNLAPHQKISLSFDLFIISSWDGISTVYGPDIWDLRIKEGPELLHTTFSNQGPQSFPDSYPGNDNPKRTGALERNSLGYTYYGDTVYHLSRTFPHTADSIEVIFSASSLQSLGDESWGLDNVTLRLISEQ